jgi:hypothetical protein
MVRASAPQGEEFVLRDGTRLRSASELADALARMDDGQFAQFVTTQKNDFARWIEFSLDDKFLAATARRTATRQALRKALFIATHR